MGMAIAFAFLALIGAALSDFTLKRFATFKNTSMGMLFLIMGVTSFCSMFLFHIQWTPLPATLFWGLLAGALSVVANIFLFRSMRYQSGGVCSTIFRLNMVPAALGAWLLLGEVIPWYKWIGIAVAVGVVFCFQQSDNPDDRKNRTLHMARRGLILCVIASFLRAAHGIVLKVGQFHGADSSGLMAMISLCWIVGGAIFGLLPEERRQFHLTSVHLRYGVIAGVLSFVIIYGTALALSYGNASVVLPIAQMSFPLTFVFTVLFLKERMTVLKFAGMLLAILAIALLSH